MRRLDTKDTGLAVRLEVHPRHQRVAEQEGQHVVAMLALVRRGVDLDAVAQAEQPQGALAPPDQVVERRQQRRARNSPRDARVAAR